MKQMLIEITGWLNMLLFSIVTMPQIIKTFRTKVVDGVSLWSYYLLIFANIDAWIYAFLINQTPLLVKYTIGFFTALLYLFVYYKYGNHKKTKFDKINIR